MNDLSKMPIRLSLGYNQEAVGLYAHSPSPGGSGYVIAASDVEPSDALMAEINARLAWLRPKISATTQRLIDLLIERDQAGLAKYGTTLDRTDLSHTEWLQHMTEEALDAAGYAQAAIRTYQEQGK